GGLRGAGAGAQAGREAIELYDDLRGLFERLWRQLLRRLPVVAAQLAVVVVDVLALVVGRERLRAQVLGQGGDALLRGPVRARLRLDPLTADVDGRAVDGLRV